MRVIEFLVFLIGGAALVGLLMVLVASVILAVTVLKTLARMVREDEL